MEIIKGGESFFLKRGKTGCLLIHGFTGSPYEMREMGEYLSQRDITALGVRLAGHATTPEDMFRTRWIDWYLSVEKGLEELKRVCEVTFAAGLSMGGLLTLHLATHQKLAGIIPLAGAIRLKDWRLVFLPLAKLWPIKSIYKFDREIGKDIKDKEAAEKMVCYSKTPVPCVGSLLELIEHTRADLREIRVPALIIQSKYDHTVPPDNAKFIYEQISSKEKELVELENSYHVITVDYDKEIVFKKTYEFIKKHENA